jgi:hypothetical protein
MAGAAASGGTTSGRDSLSCAQAIDKQAAFCDRNVNPLPSV